MQFIHATVISFTAIKHIEINALTVRYDNLQNTYWDKTMCVDFIQNTCN